MWGQTEVGWGCRDFDRMEYGLNPIQCQNECLDSDSCVGILYSYGDMGWADDRSCQLCKDYGADWSNGAFVFYRRPGNKIFYFEEGKS